MAEPKVWVFFYGSYINPGVLKEAAGIVPERFETARLHGFGIRIEPRANVIRSEQHCVYRIVTTATHRELERLYAHARSVLGETYLPEAVLVETLEGKWKPALCYIAPSMERRPAEDDYIERILRPAKEYGFPGWYVEQIESFRRG